MLNPSLSPPFSTDRRARIIRAESRGFLAILLGKHANHLSFNKRNCYLFVTVDFATHQHSIGYTLPKTERLDSEIYTENKGHMEHLLA